MENHLYHLYQIEKTLFGKKVVKPVKQVPEKIEKPKENNELLDHAMT